MKAIYEPKGPAGEYSPLAVNHNLRCSHDCEYCYARTMMRKSREQWRTEYVEKKNVLTDLEKDCPKLAGDDRNILLSFLSDPYQPVEAETRLTRKVLEILTSNGLKPTILTKGGMLATRDFDLLKKVPGSEFAVTLTTDDNEESLQWEPGAALPADRISSLSEAYSQGIYTWVSFEPVFNPEAVYRLIEQTHQFVNLYKVGKLNYHKRAKEIDWPRFRHKVSALLDSLGKDYLIKKDLKEA